LPWYKPTMRLGIMNLLIVIIAPRTQAFKGEIEWKMITE
jgi:hypothetical protein